MHQPHRFAVAAAPGAGDAGDRQGPAAAADPPGPFRHRTGDRIADSPMALEQVGRHTQQALLDTVGVGDHAPEEDLRGSGHGGQGGTEAAAGAGLGHRHGLAAAAQGLQHHRGQAVVVGPVAEGARARPQLRFQRGQQGPGGIFILRPGGEAQLHLTAAGIGRHGGVLEGQQVVHLLGQGRFGHTPEAQHAAGEHPLRETPLPQPGNGALPPHRLHLAGNPREGHHGEARPGRPDHAGGGAGGVGQQRGATGNQRLASHGGGGRAAPLGQLRLDVRPGVGVLFERGVEGGGDRLGGQVIGGGAQAAGGDQQPAAVGCFADGLDEALPVVAHHRLAMVGHPQARQLLGQPAGVAIEDVAEQQLGADTEDLGPGGWRWSGRRGKHQLRSCCISRRASTTTPTSTAVASASHRKRSSALATTSARAASHWVKA